MERKYNQNVTSKLIIFVLIAAASVLAVKIIQTGNGNGTTHHLPDLDDPDDMLVYINRNSRLYPDDLVKLAKKNEDAVEYVYRYPELAGSSPKIDLTAEASGETVPLLMQWDFRWGYEPYGDGLIGYTGCGPTCLSMVALYLTGNAEYSPCAVAEFAVKNGYCVDGNGTDWTLMSEGCKKLGVSSQEVPLSENAMAQELAAGHPIICIMGPGYFTDSGHYIVITGYCDGEFTVNDPNSVERSGRTWKYDEIEDQIRNIWAFLKD